ncbi:MAG: HEAT repeat domain-containing protein [Armatimonadota bacterium]
MIRALCILTLTLCALCRGMAQPELNPIVIQDQQDVQRLIVALDAQQPDDVRVNAARRLALVNPPEALPALVKALDDPAFAVRQHAARTLGFIGDRAAVPALIAHANERDPEARVEVVTALGRLADPRAVKVLGEELWDAEDNIRLAAAVALARIPGPASSAALRGILKDHAHPGMAPALLALGRRGDRTITAQCLGQAQAPGFNDPAVAQALAEIGDPKAIEVLVTLGSHDNVDIRAAACYGLARIGDDAAVQALVDLFRERAPGIRDNRETDAVWRPALRALPPAMADTYLRPLLLEKNFWLRSRAGEVFALWYDGPYDVFAKLHPLDRNNYWPLLDWLEARQPGACVETLLTKIDFDTVRLLTTRRSWRDSSELDGMLAPPIPWIAIRKPVPERGCWQAHPEVVKYVMHSKETIIHLNAGHLHDHAVTPMLRECVRTADVDWSARSLGRIGDPCAIPDLLKAMEGAERAQVRYGVTEGLTGCADGRHPESYQLLLNALTAENPEVRKGAIAGLGGCREARGVPFLIEQLQTDPVPEVREYCALALGFIGDTRAVEPLCEALNDNVEWARSAAAWALGEIGDPRAIDFLRDRAREDGNKRFVVRAARSLYVLGDRDAAVTLVEMANSEDANNREVAFRALLECDEQRIAGSLLATLAQRSNRDIINALGRLRAPQSTRMLLGMLAETGPSYDNMVLREAAARALGLIGEGRPAAQVTEIADALDRSAGTDPEPWVRAQAGLSLARMGDPRAIAHLEWVMRQYVPERNAAIRALWRFPDAQATTLLVEALEDDDPLGQVLAARGLCLRNDPRGPEALKTVLLATTEPVARQVAIRFAADLRDPELAPFFIRLAKAQHEEASIFINLEAIAALGKSPGPDTVKALVPLLASPASRVREAAALALNGTTTPAALAALRERLKKEDTTRVHAAIEAAVGQ